MATSDDDGKTWKRHGAALRPRPDEDAWDRLLVGRPALLHETAGGAERGPFCMWYDGRADLPPNAPAEGAPTDPDSKRHIGLAQSEDGLNWRRAPEKPVLRGDVGGVDVKRLGDRYLMLYESPEGTRAAVSDDGRCWQERGLLVGRSGREFDNHGHVTPNLVLNEHGKPKVIFMGLASHEAWDRNAIGIVPLMPGDLDPVLER